MTFIQILLIIIVIALVVGPIMAMRPNPEQRRKEQLRMAGKRMGLNFRITRLPKLATSNTEGEAISCYFLEPTSWQLLQSEWLLRRTDYSHENNFYAEWDWATPVKASPEVQEFLRTEMLLLPRDLKAIGAGPSGTSAYWNEKGDEAALADILSLLKRISAMENPKQED